MDANLDSAAHSASERKKKEKKIPVVEMFGPTIEGEGAVIGTPTMFIRFGLCDFKCTNCDSWHAVDPKLVKRLAKFQTQEEIFEDVMRMTPSHIETITFSGGNPAVHDLSFLVNELQSAGKKVVVETQGTKHPHWLRKVDHLVVSPKGPGMGEKFDPEVFSEFVQDAILMGMQDFSIKIVVFSAQDLEFAVGVSTILRELFRNPINSFEWRDNFYLSLGNPLPPKFMIDPSSEDEVINDSPSNNALVLELLQRYSILSEEILNDPRLGFARFLPQLHVLAWGNETGK